jgi:hypothetical protein
MRGALFALVAAAGWAGAAHAPARPPLVLSRPEIPPPSHSAAAGAAGAALRLRGGANPAAGSYGVLSLLPPVVALIASVALKQARALGHKLGPGPPSPFLRPHASAGTPPLHIPPAPVPIPRPLLR